VLCATFYMFLVLIPFDLKQGQLWYTIAHAVCLALTALFVLWRFLCSGVRSSTKVFKFLAVHSILWQCLFLAFADWTWAML
jgi:hypothetical protein